MWRLRCAILMELLTFVCMCNTLTSAAGRMLSDRPAGCVSARIGRRRERTLVTAAILFWGTFALPVHSLFHKHSIFEEQIALLSSFYDKVLWFTLLWQHRALMEKVRVLAQWRMTVEGLSSWPGYNEQALLLHLISLLLPCLAAVWSFAPNTHRRKVRRKYSPPVLDIFCVFLPHNLELKWIILRNASFCLHAMPTTLNIFPLGCLPIPQGKFAPAPST